MDVQANLDEVLQKIRQACDRSNRSPDEINVIAVTKYVSINRAKAALSAGVKHLGENRLEGFLEKYEEINKDAIWHFIGTLQSRKVKEVISYLDYIHSLDRLSLAKEINKRAEKPIECFVQVNASGEDSKHGLTPEETEAFVEKLEQFDKIRVVGLMTMAPYVEDEETLRNTFRTVRELKNKIEVKKLMHAPCHYLSMGMSNDYEIAIEEGATHVRIGTKLVGNEKNK